MKKGKKINMYNALDEAKKVRFSLKHPYVGTEHYLTAILADEKYEEILGVTQKQYLDKINEVIGLGTTNNKNVMTTPKLDSALDCADSLDEIIMNILDEEGTGTRILESLIGDDKIEEAIEKLEKNLEDMKFLKDMPKNLVNLNDKEYITDPAIGRSTLIEEMERTLLKMNKPNILLLGEAGVGKTALVEGLAYKIKNGDVNDLLKNSIILSVSSSQLVSGTRYRGEFEEKVENLCNYLKRNPRVILFIDEMHTTIGAGGAEGAIDMANILKPYLARGEIRVIGATTFKESKVIESDSAYTRRFTKIIIDEPTMTNVNKILELSLPKFEKFYNIKIDKKLCSAIANESRNLQGKFPDKAIDLLENICADTLWHNEKTFSKKDVERISEELQEKQKRNVVMEGV